MIKNVFNWSIGSFFRTIGRIIAYIVIASIIGLILSNNDISISNLFLPSLSAATSDGWGINLPNTLDGRFFDCSGETNCSTQKTTIDLSLTTDNGVFNYIAGDQSATIHTNGILLAFYTPTVLYRNYIYSLSVYHCSNKNLGSAEMTLYSNTYSNRGVVSYTMTSQTSSTSLSPYVYDNNYDIGDYCYQTKVVYVPAQDSSWVFLKIKSPNSSITGYVPAFISITAEPLGVYTGKIEDIVNTALRNNISGLATSSQLNQVEQNIVTEQQNTTDAVNDVNDTLNNDNVSGATSSASNFFSNFTTNTHGLTSIITAPLSAIQSLTNASCSPLVLPIPFVNQNLTLPCMRQIYVNNFGGFMTLYDTITFGIIAYWVLVRIFALVKDFKNPEHDEIEVMDL